MRFPVKAGNDKKDIAGKAGNDKKDIAGKDKEVRAGNDGRNVLSVGHFAEEFYADDADVLLIVVRTEFLDSLTD